MKQNLHVSIPKPCHENWDKMSPQQQGRHCEVCSKTVIDFSLMTDGQILETIKNNKNATCGRFSNDQLNRPLVQPLQPKWYMSGMWKYIISGFFLLKGTNGNAQVKPDVTICKKPEKFTKGQTLGMMVSYPQIDNGLTKPTKTKVNGTVLDSLGKSITGALILSTEKEILAVSDSKGTFEFKRILYPITITVNAIGFEDKKITIQQDNKHSIITLESLKALEIPTVNVPYPNLIINEELTGMSRTYGFFVLTNPHQTITETKPVYTNKRITYTVQDEDGTGLPNASVEYYQNGERKMAMADKEGKFTINKIAKDDNFELTISMVGYEKQIISLSESDLNKKKNYEDVILEKKYNALEDAVVIAPTIMGIWRKAVVKGEMVTSTSDTIYTEVVTGKLTSIEQNKFNAYPNPIMAGQEVTVSYQSLTDENIMFQLIDVNGRTIGRFRKVATKGTNIYKIQIPNNTAKQVISLLLMNSRGKWVHSTQLVVM